MKTLRCVPLGLSLLVAFAAGCHGRAPEPVVSPDAAAPAVAPRANGQDVHRIIESDHRRVIHLVVDDKIVLPSDPAFDWRVEFEDKDGFAPFTGDAGQGTLPAYRATKAGLFRMMVFGEPKCLARDGGCGTSRRRWDVTADVR